MLTSTEVDKTGGSYYGEQGLHFIGTNGESSMVPLGRSLNTICQRIDVYFDSKKGPNLFSRMEPQ